MPEWSFLLLYKMSVDEPIPEITIANASSRRNAQGTGPKPLPELNLRLYQEDDLKMAQYVYYSAYLNLVPNGVILRLKSPILWGAWIAVWGFFNSNVDYILAGWTFPWWTPIVLRIFITFAWAVVAGTALFFWVDKVVAVPKVDVGMETDMKDPEVYYFGINKVEELVEMTEEEKRAAAKAHKEVAQKESFLAKTNDTIMGFFRPKKSDTPLTSLTHKSRVQKTLKPASECTNSAFWVLTVEGVVVGIVGLDQRPGRKSNEATLRRWAVNFNYQGYGLSTILLSRVILHAQKMGIEWIDAETDEMETKAAEILAKRHGFRPEGKRRGGMFNLFGEVTSWRLDVQKWVEDYAASTEKQNQATK